MNTTPSAIYPGTFDPITLGHLDVIERASRIFEKLIIAVAVNAQKEPLFPLDERIELIRDVLPPGASIEVDSFDGLLVDYARAKETHVLIRGLRAFSDFEFEFQMALTNRKMAPDVETLFLMPKEDYSYISSSMVREIAELGGYTENFVPPLVHEALKKKIQGCTM